MKDSYEEYVQPPQYEVDEKDSDNPLIQKLKTRIQQDLNQINGVYDIQIEEASQQKVKAVEKLEKQFEQYVNDIDRQRKEEIEKYNQKAEQKINGLISNMNIPEKRNKSWWDYLFKN